MTPFKKPTEEELAKQQADILMVYRQFANTVAVNRPGIDIDLVATGEVWYGPDALSRGLVDALQTSSEYIIEKVRPSWLSQSPPASQRARRCVAQGRSHTLMMIGS